MKTQVWKPLFQSTLSKASVDSATSDMLTLLILDDGSNTFKTFMSNIGYRASCMVF